MLFLIKNARSAARRATQLQTTRSYALKPFGTDMYQETKSFTWTGMKKNPAVLPLVLIMGVAVTGCVTFIGYCSYTRPDVNFRRKQDFVDPDQATDIMDPKPLKLRVFNQKYVPMVELNEALKYRQEEETEAQQ